MRVLVCGSRDWTDDFAIRCRIALLPEDTIIMHGGARGADQAAGRIASVLGMTVDLYPAEWERYGRAAGMIRNKKMLDVGPALVLAFWRNGSRGTAHTIREAERRGIPVEVCLQHP